MAEEWRKGWHPERVRRKKTDKPVLIVGSGPTGLEATQTPGKRGYDVTLAEAGTELVGRVLKEAKLPGLSAGIRVVDYRKLQLNQPADVETYFESRLTADDVPSFGIPRVVIATGSTWRADGVGHYHTQAMQIAEGSQLLSPSDVIDGRMPNGSQCSSGTTSTITWAA